MLEYVLGFIGTIATIVISIATLAYWLGKKFAEIEERFRLIDERFREIDRRFSELERKLDTKIARLADAFTSYQEFFVEFLVHEGVIKRSARDMVVNEAKRLMRLAISVNPLTREEWEKLRIYLEKSERDELTLEEADEFLELARKVVREYGEYPEAWKLHIYATITRALIRKKYLEEQEKHVEKS